MQGSLAAEIHNIPYHSVGQEESTQLNILVSINSEKYKTKNHFCIFFLNTSVRDIFGLYHKILKIINNKQFLPDHFSVCLLV